jgi:hypothetical protein
MVNSSLKNGMFEKPRNPEGIGSSRANCAAKFRAAYPERVLLDRKGITFHLRRI